MDQQELLILARKYLDGSATETEKKRLHEWYDASVTEGTETVFTNIPSSEKAVGKNILSKLQKEIRHEKISAARARNTSGVIHRRQVKWMAAAIAILLISVSIYIDYRDLHRPGKTSSRKALVQYKNDAAPGGNKAKLLLADGSAINLNETDNGRISKQGNAQITKQSGGLVYDLSRISNTAPIMFNTLITPKGGQYQLTLSDGTKVWLNAASSLRFPTAFTGNERKVTLSGEAYFEVAKNNAMPFEVQVNGMTVKVLGTHFDVMAYGDENKVVTTLLEGAVKISKGNASAVMQPGQQATLNNSGNIAVEAADMEKAVAWKNGLFEFNDDNIEMIMRQLARWYDMEVRYEGDMQDKDFTGSIPRGSNLSEVLNMLALTGILQFRIEGKYITVQAH